MLTSDNWQDSPDKQAIIDAGIPPTSPSESAIIATLNPGTYTAVLKGANGAMGVGLVEVYDLDQIADSTLANISTRGLVQTDDKVMIAGVIIAGTQWANIVVRALGPSLPLTGTLADPVLTIETTIQPSNKKIAHSLTIANDRARSGDELDRWRLFDLKANTVTYVDNIRRYRQKKGIEGSLQPQLQLQPERQTKLDE